MNFISHFRGAMDRLAHDDRRLTSHHLALYFALFYYWNLSRFKAMIPIARDDVMNRARIGSTNTYHRCLKDLDAWGYLRYKPTFDNQCRSVVQMFRFDRGSDAGSDSGSDAGTDAACNTGSDTGSAQEVVQPLINSIINVTNGINKKNNLNGTNEYEHTHENPNYVDHWEQPGEKKIHSGDDPRRQCCDSRSGDKVAEKKRNKGGGGGVPGRLEEIEAFFAERNFGEEQAKRFFNYYSNLGWRIGSSGRLMEDWRYAATNWMLNAKRFDNDPDLKPGAIHIPADRDYQQPL